MSSFEVYERYNEISTDLIDIDPRVRQRAISRLIQLYYQAPEIKTSVLSKLEQMKEDSDKNVADYAKRMFEQIQAGKELPPSYTMRRPEMQSPQSSAASTPRTAEPGRPPPNTRNIVLNIVCCIVIIIIFIVFTYVIF